MIPLRRLNNQPIIVNCDLIESIESTPDSVVTLVSGNKLIVRDSLDEIRTKVVQFKREIYGPGDGRRFNGAPPQAPRPPS